ncbi:hypothetical protein RB653_005845 [Dictyostelium firmibasis]|uniref:tRNA (adenine(58)-N(1))-methyltransferase non-catalytic subunit TRM6 n=1 Tax=Dictyostelium firmibasis TaxID=79012 RepID=A0AAN7U8Q9_9MYCE
METETPMDVETTSNNGNNNNNNNNTIVKTNSNVIKEGDHVILDINDGEKFSVIKVKLGSKVKIGKKQILINSIIGESYYSSFQVSNEKNTLERITQKELDDRLNNLVELNQNDADNRNLDQNNTAQKLTQEDITQMKEKGTDSNTIIKTIVENSESFKTKTSFSQIKYLKKKIKKYSTIVKIIKPTLKSLTEAYYKKDSRKICGLRFDSFGQLLTLGNIRANSQVLVVETCMGLVTGSIAERMNGDGTILSAYIGKGPSLSIVNNFGFDTDVLNTIYPFNLNVTSVLNKDEDISKLPPTASSGIYDKQVKEKEKGKQQKDKVKEKEEGDNNSGGGGGGEEDGGPKTIVNQRNDTSNENIVKLLKDGVWSLVIVTKYSPLNILLSCWPYLNSSGSFVIYSHFPQPLMEVHQFLHKNQMAVNQQISEIWMREHQVLPKRTHPMMGMDGASGFILYGTKVTKPSSIQKPISSPTTTTTTTTTTTKTNNLLDIENKVIAATTTIVATIEEEVENSESALKKRRIDEEQKKE